MAARRYWRVYCRKASSTTMLCAEMEMRSSAGGADQTGSGTGSASGQNVGEEAPKAFDNNTATYWQGAFSPNLGGVWLKYDFGSGNDKDIVEIAMTPLSGFSSRMFHEMDVQSSPDDSTWTTIWSISQPTWTNAQQVFTKPTAANHRYWRLRPDVLQGGGQVMGCAELEMRATVGGADETGSGTGISRTSFSGSFLPANAYDNSTANVWSGANAVAGVVQSDWLGYDFGSGITKDIAQLAFTARTSPDHAQGPVSGWIESSTDAINWLSRWTFSGKTYTSLGTTLIAATSSASSRRRFVMSW